MSAPQWKGLFEWSMQHADGTRISDMNQTTIDPGKMAWLQNVLQNYIKDLVERLKEIKAALEEQENVCSSLEQQEALLDELQEIVEDLDQARNLHLIGGVPLLIDLLQSPHKSLRWRASEIIATCVQNNEDVQKAFFDDGMLPLVQTLTCDEDDICRLKGWMAVSCLVRNFQPALDAFLKTDGFNELLKTLDADNVRLLRRELFLLQYIISQRYPGHLDLLKETRTLSQLVKFLDCDDIDVRENTFAVLVAVSASPEGRTWLVQETELEQKLSGLEKKLDSLTEAGKQDRSSEIELLRELISALHD